MESIFYIILAILGLDLLIVIHELGHYFMAKKVGVRVEEFSVGFGKPICQWKRNGVNWKIGMIPFGGYVRMAGMEKKPAKGGEPSTQDPHKIKDGFLGKSPFDQIKIAAAGPIANFIFALVIFGLLFALGGRNQSFSQATNHIGWVEKESGPFLANIRPGDQILQVSEEPFTSFESFIQGAIHHKGPLQIDGLEIDYQNRQTTPFTYAFNHNTSVEGLDKARLALATLRPAAYLIYEKMPDGSENSLPKGSPLTDSGISYGDRIMWVDGKLIFSLLQLIDVLNSPFALLTIERDSEIFQTRIPLVAIRNLRLSSFEKQEIGDWKEEASIGDRLDALSFIPYNLNATCIVEDEIAYVDQKAHLIDAYKPKEREGSIALLPGDRILAVGQSSVANSFELLASLQNLTSTIITQKTDPTLVAKKGDEDLQFQSSFDVSHIQAITNSFGKDLITSSGPYHLLKPVTPLERSNFPISQKQKARETEQRKQQQEAIEKIKDPQRKEAALAALSFYTNRKMLGVKLQDRYVALNPNPLTLFGQTFSRVYRTLISLFTGSLSPKYLAGPIGIVQTIQYGWSKGFKEALYWLGLISVNLGCLNLLPIPVLDGGHIVFALWEKITRKPLSIETREKLVYPFVIGLIALFLFFTYNDLSRIFSQFF